MKCLLTQIYTVWWSQLSIKCAQDELLSKQMSQHLQLHVNQNSVFPLTIQMSSAIHYLPASGYSFSFTKPALHFPCSNVFIPMEFFIHLIRSKSRARARRLITCDLDIVPQNLYTVGSAEIRPQDWRWAFRQCWLSD